MRIYGYTYEAKVQDAALLEIAESRDAPGNVIPVWKLDRIMAQAP